MPRLLFNLEPSRDLGSGSESLISLLDGFRFKTSFFSESLIHRYLVIPRTELLDQQKHQCDLENSLSSNPYLDRNPLTLNS